MNFQNTTSLTPEQVKALAGLLAETPDSFALEVAPDIHLGIRAVLYVGNNSGEDEDAEAFTARWFKVGVAGKVDEVAADPDEVAA